MFRRSIGVYMFHVSRMTATGRTMAIVRAQKRAVAVLRVQNRAHKCGQTWFILPRFRVDGVEVTSNERKGGLHVEWPVRYGLPRGFAGCDTRICDEEALQGPCCSCCQEGRPAAFEGQVVLLHDPSPEEARRARSLLTSQTPHVSDIQRRGKPG